jgi:tRNA pseudouridine13 synthase
MITASEQDRNLGMEFYATDAGGCGGILRSSAEDFQVDEVYPDFNYEGGRYLVLEVEKKDWDTHHLIRELSGQLRISQKRFGWAGTKDKRAVTRQRISIMNLDESELARITLPDIKIRVLGRTNRGVDLGDLLGNRFKIKIKEMNCRDLPSRLARITEEIRNLLGIPNYFGTQRFGEIRPVTHKVGEALVRGKTEEAVFTYLAMPFSDEPVVTRNTRQILWDERDVRKALKTYPSYLRYELAMLNYLVERPEDYAGSFNVLSPNLRHMFVHAYQSYIFNRILSRRMAEGLPLGRAVDGDVVCFAKGGLPDHEKAQAVTQDNLDAVNRLIDRGRAWVTLPLFGFESSLADGEEGRIEGEILRDECVTKEAFRIPANPDLGSRGTRRTALLMVAPSVMVHGSCAELEFFLSKGSYATVVLREYMKTGNLMEGQ